MPWPHALPLDRVAFVSAALRHVTDAQGLVSASPVQAFHLAGYGPECVRKAALTYDPSAMKELDKAIGHGFRKDVESTLALVIPLDPLAVRYELPGWKTRFSVLTTWSEEVRYQASDHLGRGSAQKLVDVATELVTEVTTALWADGRLPPLADLVRVKP
jgi:hypothetical protein